jgi:hypothetical protein
MELTLNLGWALVGVALVWLWLRFAPREGAGRRIQVLALAVLILILFPVISVTDDLAAAQNPAETEGSMRRDHVISSAHSIFPEAVTLPLPAFAEVRLVFLRCAAPGNPPSRAVEHPGLAEIENRPPPSA